MERLNKQYSLFEGEMLHLRNDFPTFPFHIHQLNISTFHFYPDSGITIKTNRKNVPVGFFLQHNL
jgi:hypothetical protein